MFGLFELNSTIDRSSSPKQEDIFKTKSALNDLGYMDKPSWAQDDEEVSPVDGIASEDMFDATKKFQKDNGLKVDGVIKPDGETANAINKKMAERGGTIASAGNQGSRESSRQKTKSIWDTEPAKPKAKPKPATPKAFDIWGDKNRTSPQPQALPQVQPIGKARRPTKPQNRSTLSYRLSPHQRPSPQRKPWQKPCSTWSRPKSTGAKAINRKPLG